MSLMLNLIFILGIFIFYKKLKKNDSFTLFNDIEKKLNNSLINDDIDKNNNLTSVFKTSADLNDFWK